MKKEYILEEIKRTAIANDGTALGRNRFYKETGIKESDWLGKHWVRWSEAITEAGLTPNRMTEAYKDDLLIEKLIDLARELGRLPVSAEFRFKAHNDAGFPAESTFKSRLGTKKQWTLRIAQYCRTHEGLDDVLEMCEIVVSRELPHDDVGNQKDAELGFVYLLKWGRTYKIGRSNAVGRRERELAIQLPEKASTVHVIRTDDPVGIEAYWHKRFESKRKHGEWFELATADVQAFRRRKFM